MTLFPFEPSEVERLLRKVSCPVCSGEKIDVTWEAGLGATLKGRAACEICRFVFHLQADPARLHEDEQGLTIRIGRSICPECNAQGGTLICRCDLSSGERFYLLVCSKCGFPYKEVAEPLQK
jgi:transcription elongation factor Elf1